MLCLLDLGGVPIMAKDRTRACCIWNRSCWMKVVKTLQEMVKSAPKVYPKHQRE